jgi:hypothetical protein
MSKDKKLTYRQKASISFVDQEDPPFLQQMKKKVGFRETKIEDKFATDDVDDDNEVDRDDIRNMKEEDRPQVVVLDPETNITTAELDEEIRKKEEEDDKKKIEEGKIVFRKPQKRPAENSENESNEKKKKEQTPPTNKSAGKTHSRLLSFGDEDD